MAIMKASEYKKLKSPYKKGTTEWYQHREARMKEWAENERMRLKTERLKSGDALPEDLEPPTPPPREPVYEVQGKVPAGAETVLEPAPETPPIPQKVPIVRKRTAKP